MKTLDKKPEHKNVLLAFFVLSIVGVFLALYLVNQKAKHKENILKSVIETSLKEGVNKDSLKKGIIESDTLN